MTVDRRTLLLGGIALGAGLRAPPLAAAALVPFHPVQAPCPAHPEVHGARTVTSLAAFRARGVVLGTRHYAEGREAEIAAWDVVLGWGAMSDPAVIAALRVEQRGRYAAFYWTDEALLAPDDIILNSANIHIIPDAPSVLPLVAALAPGDVLQVEGHLVQIDDADGWRWRSSLSRADTGDGACELMRVRRAARIA